MSDKKTIQFYDDQAQMWADILRTGQHFSHKYIIEPAMRSKIPNLKNKHVLCVGCGTGEECEYIKNLGAHKVIGMDISKGEIEVATKSFPDLNFHIMDSEKIDFEQKTFDFIYSNLVFHYLSDWSISLQKIHNVLKKDGTFLFSTHHPLTWGAQRKKEGQTKTSFMGYIKQDAGYGKPIGDYLNARKIDDIWFDKFKVSYYHKPLSLMFKYILNSGFEIIDLIEPKPVCFPDDIPPYFLKIYEKIPLFIVFELKKKVI